MPSGAEGALRLPFFQVHPDARPSLGCVEIWTLDSPPVSAGQYLLPLPGPTSRQCPTAALCWLPSSKNARRHQAWGEAEEQVTLKSQRAVFLPHQRLDLLF